MKTNVKCFQTTSDNNLTADEIYFQLSHFKRLCLGYMSNDSKDIIICTENEDVCQVLLKEYSVKEILAQQIINNGERILIGDRFMWIWR